MVFEAISLSLSLSLSPVSFVWSIPVGIFFSLFTYTKPMVILIINIWRGVIILPILYVCLSYSWPYFKHSKLGPTVPIWKAFPIHESTTCSYVHDRYVGRYYRNFLDRSVKSTTKPPLPSSSSSLSLPFLPRLKKIYRPNRNLHCLIPFPSGRFF